MLVRKVESAQVDAMPVRGLQFDNVIVWISEVEAVSTLRPSHFTFDLHTAALQAILPPLKVGRRYSEGNMQETVASGCGYRTERCHGILSRGSFPEQE
jgi:hypothetical protein